MLRFANPCKLISDATCMNSVTATHARCDHCFLSVCQIVLFLACSNTSMHLIRSVVMSTQFDDLPAEVKLEIFELVAISAFRPRIVEIYFKNGSIYSKTPPPTLSLVCQLSREVTLREYKPWCAQFRGLHRPWEGMIEKYGEEGMTRLQNVFVDFKNDELLINEKQWSPWNFGPLELRYLRKLVLNLSGWLNWSKSIELVLGFRKLQSLGLYDTSDDSNLRIKKRKIKLVLRYEEKKNGGEAVQNRARYVPPKIKCGTLPTPPNPPKVWITYKYRPQSEGLRSSNLDCTLPLEEPVSMGSVVNSISSTKRRRLSSSPTRRKAIRLDDYAARSLQQRQEALTAIRIARNSPHSSSSPSSSPQPRFNLSPDSPLMQTCLRTVPSLGLVELQDHMHCLLRHRAPLYRVQQKAEAALNAPNILKIKLGGPKSPMKTRSYRNSSILSSVFGSSISNCMILRTNKIQARNCHFPVRLSA